MITVKKDDEKHTYLMLVHRESTEYFPVQVC
jgi:hypothetical protein